MNLNSAWREYQGATQSMPEPPTAEEWEVR
jgi:hypothetical protein